MTMRRILAMLAACGFFLTACGDSGGSDESSSQESDGGALDLGGAIDPNDLDQADDFIDSFLPEGCQFAFDFQIAMAASITGQSNLEQFLDNDPPAAIADDVETVLTAIQDADGLIEVGQALSSPEVEEANERISAFVEANCDGDDIGG